MPRGISEDDVFQAADTLLTRGERPTIERVRHALGRGSPNTVNRMLDAWWRSLSQRLQGKEAATALPAPLARQVEALYAQLRESAVSEAMTVLAARESALTGKEQALTQQTAELVAQKAASEKAMTALQEELAHLRDIRAAQETTFQELRTALSTAQQDAARLTGRLNAAEAERGRLIDAHEAERIHLQNQSDAQEKHWLSEIDRLRQDLKLAKAETQKQTATLNLQREEFRKLTAHTQAAESLLRREIERLQKQLTQERERRAKAEARVTADRELIRTLKAARHPSKRAPRKKQGPPALTVVKSKDPED